MTRQVKRLVTLVALVFAISSTMTSVEAKDCSTGAGASAGHSGCDKVQHTAQQKPQKQRQVASPPAQPKDPRDSGFMRDERGGGRY
jgi:hypothetical protein